MTIIYRGMLGKNHSWSTVSVNILLELQKKGLNFICQSTNDPSGIPEELRVIPLQLKLPPSEVSLSYTIPPNLVRIPAKHRIAIYNNDSSHLPSGWAKLLNEKAHLVLPSSQFAYDVLKDNGVTEDRMKIVPHGYDPEVFHPDVESSGINDSSLDDLFKFVMVAAPHKRKNHEGLMRAFIEEFKDDKDVALIIKTSHNSHESAASFHLNFDKLLAKLKKDYKYEWPKMVLVPKRIPSLAGLYKYCQAMVLPTKSECFSLTCLESAMCKLPIITTDYGGHLDYLNEDNSYLVDYVMEKMPIDEQYHTPHPNAYQALPLKDDLKRLMRHVKDNYSEAQQKAEKCYEDNKHLTWDYAAQMIYDLIEERGWKI